MSKGLEKMKTIEHSFGADLTWVKPYTESLNGKIEGNFIVVPEEINTGVRYFLDCGDGVTALYIDVKYNTEILFLQKNTKDDFVGIYYDLTHGEANISNNYFLYNLGCYGYNLSIIDSILDTQYHVKEGTRTFALCIFIKKINIKNYAEKHHLFRDQIDKIMDPEKNVFIKFDRISFKSNLILEEFRKAKPLGSTFDLSLIATAHLLVSDYLDQMLKNSIIVEKVNQIDFLSIIQTQDFLIQNGNKPFPSIGKIAREANMSESKFKKLFCKITGLTPNVFFMTNKMHRAKELLSEEKRTISEVVDELNFGDYSYFISRFKKHYGVSPYTFIRKA